MWNRTGPRRLAGLAGWLLLSLAAGAIGAVASVNAKEFYAQLAKPGMGTAWRGVRAGMDPAVLPDGHCCVAGLARSRLQGAARGALTLFIIQLAVNALWSWLYFGWRMGAASFVEVLVLWALILGDTGGLLADQAGWPAR